MRCPCLAPFLLSGQVGQNCAKAGLEPLLVAAVDYSDDPLLVDHHHRPLISHTVNLGDSPGCVDNGWLELR
ncbi:MAG TPA: hypothetical protein VMM37_06990, partial [Bacteroidota bacterium]|nr:hypothetical protein [Bacteroidota bacterium]